jgi:predicted phosphate transport protein (TIGR00153 family)
MGFNFLDLLLPREGKFFDYLAQQTNNLLEGCCLFEKSIACLEQSSDEEKKQYFSAIKECERTGDMLEIKILDELNETFITPIDREDIHSIVTEIDTALDIVNGTARKMEVYRINRVPDNIKVFTSIIVAIVKELALIINALKKKSPIKDGIANMHKMENEADELFHQCMFELFTNGFDAVEIVKMKEIYERLESVVDVVDRIGKMIRGIKVKTG